MLAESGTLYLHLDYREAHGAKLLCDEVFGRECFLNEIVWAYDYGARTKRRWPAKHDTILVYVKDPERYWFDSAEVDREPYMAPGLVGAEKAARGKLPTDVWWHTIVSPTGREKTGYPTQKPEGIVRRMVLASSRRGDWCLDFFAGSGTLGAVASSILVGYGLSRFNVPFSKTIMVVLIATIILSVVAVMLESVQSIGAAYGRALRTAEWVFTIAFTVEYVLRLGTVGRPRAYATSFFGIVDLLAILPVYISLVIPGAQSLLVVRSLRLLRVFRVFKMAQWLQEANYLLRAVQNSTQKILVFLLTVLLINVIVGSTMYAVEGPANGFDSMFTGVYWSIVTMSTVGFGDIAPNTGLGQVLAACLMILGYSVIAVPTGIVSAEVTTARNAERRRPCPSWGHTDRRGRARSCERCGKVLDAGART